jgi:Ca-activated chloride channel homolog
VKPKLLLEAPVHVSAHLNVDVVAVERDDEITVLLELAAPAMPTEIARPAATVQIVVDRSGSMSGERLDAAKLALTRLVDRLDATDNFGVVAFDNDVTVVVPAGPLADKPAARRSIAAIDAGGSTNLSAGYLRGLQEVRRVCGQSGATLIIVSDGEANDGIVEAGQLAGIAARAQAQAITTTTVGIGLGYDEVLLAAISAGGAGNHVFAEGADDAGPVLAREVSGLLSKTVQAATLRMTLAEGIEGAAISADHPLQLQGRDATLELGDLWAGEKRNVLLGFTVPAVAALGLAQIVTIELRYVAIPALREEVITLPISVNVVPADIAARRVANPQVVVESLFQTAQIAKRSATRSLQHGDAATASKTFGGAAKRLRDAATSSPELADEAELLDDLARRALDDDASRVAKFSTYDLSTKTAKRGQTASSSWPR